MRLDENKNINPLLLSLLTLIFLFLFSTIEYPEKLSIFKLRSFCLYDDIIKKEVKNDKPVKSYYVAKNKINMSFFKAITDTFNEIQSNQITQETSNELPNNKEYEKENYEHSFFFKPLENFFIALKQAEQTNKKVRVAYFGDSMIEGDLITKTIRELLQNKFGGNGVGFVPVTTRSAQYRNTIHHTFSNDWEAFPFNKYKDKDFGLSGYVFNPTQILSSNSHTDKTNSWVAFKSSNISKRLNKFHIIKLYHGASNEQNVLNCEIDKSFKYTKPIMGKNVVNELLAYNKPSQEVKLNFCTNQSLNVYGVSFEDTSGIYIDNYSFRGNSGAILTSIPHDILTEFNKYMDYKLVVLQYGLNVSDPNIKNYGWYERTMTKVINHIKQTMPEASILLISVSDRAWKNGMHYETSPSIPKLVNAQKNIAKNNNVAFWNLFEAMGGENSMIEWVNKDKPLANKDYTHLNYRGAFKVAQMMTNDILNEYESFKSCESLKYITQVQK